MPSLTTSFVSHSRGATLRLGAALAVLLIVLVAVLVATPLWLARSPAQPQADGLAAMPAPAGTAPSHAPGAAAQLREASPAPSAATASPPAGAAAADDDVAALTPEQRQQLAAALADHPQRDAELRRIAQYMRFQAQLEQWRQADAAKQPALARQLERALDERLARREMSAGEAQQLKAALLSTSEPDATRRAAALTRWQREVGTAALPAVDLREARYLQAQADALARWQALAAAGRDPALLQAELQRLREQAFAAGAATADTPAATSTPTVPPTR